MRTWFKDDGAAKSIVLRKINSSVLTLILYDRSDVSLQFSLRAQISTFQMKGATEAEKYVALHTHANDRLARMGARPSEADTIYALLRGLPRSGIWPVIQKNIETELERSEQSVRMMGPSMFNAVPAASQSSWPPPAITPVTPRNPFTPTQQYTNPFLAPAQHSVSRPSQHAMPVIGTYTFRHAGPGSEYASAAIQGAWGEVNPVTGLRKTRNNLSGTACTTPICLGRKRVDHDWNNCFQQGGGKAGQAPWQRGKAPTTTTQTAAVVTQMPLVPATPQSQATGQTNVQVVAAAIPCPPVDDYFRNLSCAIVEELSEGTGGGSEDVASLIKDPSFFWTFTHDSTVSMKTANQGNLNTEGYGDCVAILKVGGKRVRLRLQHCLYAPNAVVNLLSVGRMLERGWEVQFKGEPSRCELIHGNESLGHINMRGQLCFLDVEFIRPSGISGMHDWDMQEAISLGFSRQRRMGFGSLQRHPSSTSTPTRGFLELVHTDLCGPFPVPTLHGKRYFIVFIDDYTNVISVHLLATKDQVYDAWLMVKARWENRFNTKVKAIQTDNGGEYMGGVFTSSLRDAGVEHRRSVALEGRALAALSQASLPAAYFGEAVLTTGYLWNLTSTRVLPLSVWLSLLLLHTA